MIQKMTPKTTHKKPFKHLLGPGLLGSGILIFLLGCQSPAVFPNGQRTSLQQSASLNANSSNRLWQELAPLPEPRYNLQATEVDGQIYASGGFNDAAILDSFERFDPASGRWDVLPPLPAPRYIHAAVGLNHKLYLFGGYQFASHTEALLQGDIRPQGAMAQADCYDPTTGQWQSLPPLQTPRFMPMAASLQGKIYVAGGGGPNRELLDSMEVYDPNSQKF